MKYVGFISLAIAMQLFDAVSLKAQNKSQSGDTTGISTYATTTAVEQAAMAEMQESNYFIANTDVGTGGFVLANSAQSLRWIIRGLNAETGTGNTGYDLEVHRRDDAGNAIGTVMFIKRSTGNVGIGTNNPGTNKLAVEGTIGARRVKVTQTAWADFVFHPDYNLPALSEVEKFVKTNRHLPDIPSAAEVEKEGLDLGEMNKKLLQKVEELTLYLIDIKKEINQLKEQNELLNVKIDKSMQK